ncbi:respiratory nitrate reductase subunit gamma [Desulfosporosinus meridiei]|uniref:Nitrate reductase gamma subunit n=1 Tax=Desulfosporosinus meridiei (strain ATCC BAA-275 / DSM 13257 / KCTC 12902 / NCIMB 13706 / S10) TaxID=768704 RepID=J7J0J7_DESMD|nr:respiratory nitrate reductase subunit gamma [Desulfosporosinus meridiei]AFQ44486.1 nitrate reductase gamma subunit [Desulfosporosinus meridiei DSM 13257]
MILSIIAYLSIGLFVGISVFKAYKFAKMPFHGRMDLYPVPKEKGFEHGGSYYEETAWWTKPHEVSHMREIAEMLKEILFIKKLFENQRPFWWISYALHLGIYFLMAWTILLVVGGLFEVNGISVTASTSSILGLLVYYVTALTGYFGLALATLGSGLLFLRRAFDNTLKKYTTPQEYFNLLLIFAALFTGIFTWGNDLSFGYAREVTANLVTFTPFSANGLLTLHIFLVGIMLIYIPISKMSHYVGKYFTFHKVLWDNNPNLKGSGVEQEIKKASSFRPSTSWSAPHINPPAAPEK